MKKNHRRKGYGVMCSRCGKTYYGMIIAYATSCKKCGYIFNSQDAAVAVESAKLTKQI